MTTEVPNENSWLRRHPHGVTVVLHVQPKGGVDDIVGVRREALHVRVTAPPEKGKANVRVLKVVAEAFGVPRSRVRLIGGEKSRRKVVLVAGMSVAEAARHLREFV